MSVTAGQRTREFGVRLALGATRREIARLVLRRGAAIAVIGIAGGAAGVVAGRQLFEHLLFQVRGADPIALGATVAVAFAATLLACYVPARRATQVDPLVALRD
jgi:putative ABC transport system permease protein